MMPTSLANLPPAVSGDEPLYRQVYERFRGAIAQGTLKPGDRIPSARALAKDLGVARGTIEMAYSLLHAEGYVQPRGQAGTVVTPGLQAQATPRPLPAPAKADPDTWRQPPTLLPFQMGLPALDAFPRKIWARLGARHLRATQAADLSYPPADGLPALRNAIAAHLQVARGIHCSPAQVFITSGYRESLNLVIQALLHPGDQVWVEDPGYPPTRELLKHSGLTFAPVEVDAEGIMVSRGIAQAPGASAAVVTPAHQSPLSVTLSLTRRQALLEWAERNQRWIVEDDYDGEYRYVSRPLPALKSLDRHGRVLYAGTFSKVMFPGIRLAYLVVPEAQVRRFEDVNRVLGNGIPGLTQAMVGAFMLEGHFARHIQRMRRLYSERRNATAAGLAKVFGPTMPIHPQPGGMHLLVRMQGHQTDRPLAQRMVEHGIYAHALSRWTTHAPCGAGLLMSFTNIESQERAEQLGRRILELM
ncbi:DNA-binding protein [Achromobacter xylosoxidans]|jgi:GntR family transcriptional regulator / MocR family aminotransferase|uniref:PLP-dependent aminotransferase family protein n=3 Tax=Burkholderiales TaxID=80840 RepID=A0A848N7R8_9BURK|nr:PLP-dependent aminotransferase family protein [Achromobacter ruhlandii]ALX82670.1 DNA-binding protein [Achromobacter denitrificans]AMG43415.1 PLP-dependent aminotransferase family protein [Achromobacter xylosoxidans]MCI1836237.1 PLP-dependent aminotransferase family protein [Achromobacter ruhlandii]MCV6794889.1 PLP-dependent aminotransferase family protein [Achromobacter ruhlandii]MCV6800458.1 PLP-dependent aminotransferase family protein [Achromobacter ruhlandii]